jgi:small multidrug resistance family-3 protein
MQALTIRAESFVGGTNSALPIVMKYLIVLLCLIVATVAESFGDATIRIGLFERAGTARLATILAGGALLLFYGMMLNLAPLPFNRIVGFYIATLFVVWQVVNFVTFRSPPTAPILAGGALIVIGGLVVSFWNA